MPRRQTSTRAAKLKNRQKMKLTTLAPDYRYSVKGPTLDGARGTVVTQFKIYRGRVSDLLCCAFAARDDVVKTKFALVCWETGF